MIQLFRAFIDHVATLGVKSLAEAIDPRLGKAVDFFQGVREKYAKRKALKDQKEEAERIARMSAEQVAADIREEVAKAFPDKPKLREEVELYLSLAPGAVQRTLRGKHDPKGLSAPADFALNSPEKMAAMFPAAVPTLRPNDPVPGREEKYLLIAPIGGGGFGEVWKAADLMKPGHFTAIKVFPDPKIQLAVIRHEYRQALRLNDPKHGWPAGVVPVVDAELKGEHPWIMYEFVGGGTLAELIVQWQTLDVPERVRKALLAMKSLAGTCSHMHELNPALVHRDLKPANVLRDGDGKQLLITDLGLGGAAVEYELATENQGYRSVSGRLPSMLFGSYSLNYASPEQRRGNPPDPRDDIHALGVIAYQMLTGKLDGAPGADTADELNELRVPQDVIRLVTTCAAGDAKRRPLNAAALVDELAKLSPKQIAVAKPVATARKPEPRRLRPESEPRREEQKREYEPIRKAMRKSEGSRLTVFRIGGLCIVGLLISLVAWAVSGKRTADFGQAKGWAAVGKGTKPGEEITLPLGKSGVDMTFCWCPPGTYDRGSTEQPDEQPVRRVTISKGFWMAKYETTQAQWKAAGFSGESRFQGDSLPVENVTWLQATAFAIKIRSYSSGLLFSKEGKTHMTRGFFVRLPTEAEWEYACLADTAAGQQYWSGSSETALDSVGWYDTNSKKMTHPIGQKRANPWGLHDMHGNVWEWCADWYDEEFYKKSLSVDPECRDGEQKYRIQRGGSCARPPVYCRTAMRGYFDQVMSDGLTGFRVCFNPE